MFSFYRVNFCCDCGTKLSLENSWWRSFFLSKYFCISCGKRLKVFIWKRRILLGFLLSILPIFFTKIYFAKLLKKEDYINNKVITNISTIETQSKPIASIATIKESFWVCGAKTKKGKKCQRRVKTPGYCWQHQNLIK